MPTRKRSLPSPDRFGLTSFADLLPARPPIIGEDAGSFKGFQEGMMRSLAPFTAYEAVIAENLIAIEWELLQHRRMREAALRSDIEWDVKRAVVARQRARHEAAQKVARAAFIKKNGEEAAWKEPAFDETAAEKLGEALAARAVSPEPAVQAKAHAEIVELGLRPIDLMSRAYLDADGFADAHDEKVQQLERRRREVKRDYDALQRLRPVEAEVIDA